LLDMIGVSDGIVFLNSVSMWLS